MKRQGTLSLLPFLFLLMTGCPGNKEKSKEEEMEKGANGKRIYREKCSSCHGPDGKKGVSGASDLSKSQMSMEERIKVIENGKGAMIPFKNVLEKDETRAVATYLEELRKPE